MAGSFSFDGVNLSTKGLGLLAPLSKEILTPSRSATVEVLGKPGAYAFPQRFTLRRFNLDCYVQGDSHSDLLSKLQEIASLLNPQKGLKQLLFDTQTDRYYLAKVSKTMVGRIKALDADVAVDFVVPDPFPFSTSESSYAQDLTSNPQTYSFGVGGDAQAVPVYTLTAQAADAAVTATLSSDTRGEAIVWKGSLAIGNTLEIDCDQWVVKKNGAVDMANVSGEFPVLNPGSNQFTMSGFPISGSSPYSTINHVWRNRYL